jgi:hypothetical protein
LELRRTGFGTSQHQDGVAYHVVQRDTVVGRIHQSNTPRSWLWTVYSHDASEGTGGQAASLDEARSKFKQAWIARSGDGVLSIRTSAST